MKGIKFIGTGEGDGKLYCSRCSQTEPARPSDEDWTGKMVELT
jgi:hypothetical protein